MAALCRYASGCPVCRNDLGLDPAIARRYRHRFCAGDWRECARYAVADEAGATVVPQTLLPTDHTAAYELVSSKWLSRSRSPASLVFGGS